MAEVNGPRDDSTADDRRYARPDETSSAAAAVPARGTADEERGDRITGEPRTDPDEERDARLADSASTDSTATDDLRRDPGDGHPVAEAAATRADEEPATRTAPAPFSPTAAPPPIQPAAGSAPNPPKRGSNRLAGTAWVLLAAGLFEVLFLAVNALVALVFGGSAAVVPQIQSIAGTSLAWLPVVLFFLLFELTVLVVNRAGRVAYVFTSLIVGAAVYILTVLLFSLIVRHTLGDSNTLAQTFLNWEFILVGLVARETMLWIGLAIGSRGIRVRRRNRAERLRYKEELADARS